MKKKIPLACLLAFLATACSTMTDPGSDKGRPSPKGGGSRDMPFMLPELPLPDDTRIARSGARAIQVYVVANDTDEDASVDEEPIYRQRNNRDEIVFRLRTSGYAFPITGAVTTPTPPPHGEEIDCATTTSGIWRYREVRCNNPHHLAGRYKYVLQVVRADGSPLTPVDPFIVNR